VHCSVSESGDVPFLNIRIVFQVVVDIVCLHINRSMVILTLGGLAVLPLEWEVGVDDARGMNAEAHGAAANLLSFSVGLKHFQ
jgi:hypothetical protein